MVPTAVVSRDFLWKHPEMLPDKQSDRLMFNQKPFNQCLHSPRLKTVMTSYLVGGWFSSFSNSKLRRSFRLYLENTPTNQTGYLKYILIDNFLYMRRGHAVEMRPKRSTGFFKRIGNREQNSVRVHSVTILTCAVVVVFFRLADRELRLVNPSLSVQLLHSCNEPEHVYNRCYHNHTY